MELVIQPVSADNLNDWLAFFDAEAFSDNPEWSGCYCGYYFEADDPSWFATTKEQNRESAIRNITSGRMTGLLAYAEGTPVGWVHAGDRLGFPRLCVESGYVEAGTRRDPSDPASGPIGRGKAIVCFMIHPKHRGKGIATALMERVVADAAGEGYAYVEASPFRHATSCATHYHGPAVMYEKAGFQKVLTLSEVEVWRKYL